MRITQSKASYGDNPEVHQESRELRASLDYIASWDQTLSHFEKKRYLKLIKKIIYKLKRTLLLKDGKEKNNFIVHKTETSIQNKAQWAQGRMGRKGGKMTGRAEGCSLSRRPTTPGLFCTAQLTYNDASHQSLAGNLKCPRPGLAICSSLLWWGNRSPRVSKSSWRPQRKKPASVQWLYWPVM